MSKSVQLYPVLAPAVVVVVVWRGRDSPGAGAARPPLSDRRDRSQPAASTRQLHGERVAVPSIASNYCAPQPAGVKVS